LLLPVVTFRQEPPDLTCPSRDRRILHTPGSPRHSPDRAYRLSHETRITLPHDLPWDIPTITVVWLTGRCMSDRWLGWPRHVKLGGLEGRSHLHATLPFRSITQYKVPGNEKAHGWSRCCSCSTAEQRAGDGRAVRSWQFCKLPQLSLRRLRRFRSGKMRMRSSIPHGD
jgi:hypothetical protein